jgi:hypothetical protein
MKGPDPVQSKVGRFDTSLARIRLLSDLQWQTACHSNVAEKASDPAVCRPANLADLVNVVNLVKLVGRQRNLNCVLSIPNALMRWSSVDGGTPSLAAAPDRPATRPRDAASAASMNSRSVRGSPSDGAGEAT